MSKRLTIEEFIKTLKSGSGSGEASGGGEPQQYLNPVPIPAYMVQNPNCCGSNWYSNCGCNSVA